MATGTVTNPFSVEAKSVRVVILSFSSAGDIITSDSALSDAIPSAGLRNL